MYACDNRGTHTYTDLQLLSLYMNDAHLSYWQKKLQAEYFAAIEPTLCTRIWWLLKTYLFWDTRFEH